MIGFAGRLAAAVAVTVCFGAAGVQAAPKAPVAQAWRKARIAPAQAWAEAERDAAGDVRVLVFQRGMPVAERAAARVERRALGRVKRSFDRLGGDVIKVAPSLLEEVLADLEADPDVEVVVPDRRGQRIQAQVVPWGVLRIHAEPASRAALGLGGGAGVKVAVVDTGIWWSSSSGSVHPDLKAAYKGGYDFVDDDPYPWDDNGHGTHVAGILAARDNTTGVVGVAPGVSLYALKVLDRHGWGYDSDVIAALDWCIAHGIRVVNYSGGSTEPSDALEAACSRARAAGVTIVAAAGNDAAEGLRYPAAYESVIAVGATDQSDIVSPISNSGAELDLVAPGESIRSTYLGGGTVKMSGTSMAVPHVAGAAALLAGRNVSDPRVVQEYLQGTAVDLGPVAGHDPDSGFGLVDAAGVLAGLPPAIATPAPGETVPSGAVYGVSWGPVADAATYRVLFARSAGADWSEVAAAVNGTSAEWHVPVVGGALTSGRIQVAAYRADGFLLSVGTQVGFAVRSLSITAPAAGASYPGGQPLQVSWDVYATPRPVSAIVVDLSKDGGKTWTRLKKFAGASVRTYDWMAPSVTGTRARRLRVSLLDGSGVATSRVAVSFTLVPPGP